MISAEEREQAREQLMAKYQIQRAAEKTIVDTLLAEGDFLDDDGYPTESAEKIVAMWPSDDAKGWFTFINSIWHLKSWGWSEGEEPHDCNKERKVYRYHISTAGWSGNESLIAAMKNSSLLWHFTWVQSRRGGHYIFEIDNEE